MSEHIDPIPVHVTNHPPAAEQSPNNAPDFSSWNSWVLAGTEKAFRLLPRAPQRARAVITVGPGAGNNTTGYVLLGSENKVCNGVGGRLQSGQMVEVQGMAGVWCAGDGANSLTVTIVDERWA